MFKNPNLERITIKSFGITEKKALKYEGQYLNGKRHRKGKEFNKEGGLIYEGEYAFGQWHGNGKQYDQDFLGIGNKTRLLYEGEFKKGRWNGKGKEYEKGLIGGGLKHEGNFIDGKFIG